MEAVDNWLHTKLPAKGPVIVQSQCLLGDNTEVMQTNTRCADEPLPLNVLAFTCTVLRVALIINLLDRTKQHCFTNTPGLGASEASDYACSLATPLSSEIVESGIMANEAFWERETFG